MKVLVSNDDGIFAPGIETLVKAFAAAGHEVFVCAPDRQRSAASHSLTIGRPLTVKTVQMDGAKKAWAIGGTPADCVKLGLTVLCPEAEAVVSGINRGYNVGTDILYSGTVAAAMEGAICGRPAIAVSQHECREEYESAAALAVREFASLKDKGLAPLCVLNLNYPERGEAKGLIGAVMGQILYDENYMPECDGSGEITYTLKGTVRTDVSQSDDYEKLCKGYATATVLHYDMTERGATNVWNYSD